MQVFRRLAPVAAISFDLDDTLYDNRPIIAAAEAAMLASLARHFPLTRPWGKEAWRHHKLRLLAQLPQLVHDPSALRLETLRTGLLHFGLSQAAARQGAAQLMGEFFHARSNFQVPASVLALLDRLGRGFPLIGLTNGNVDPQRIGLGARLSFVLAAGKGLRMKPHGDLFALACQRLDIAPQQLLHVGDSQESDIQGALAAGCQAALLNPACGRDSLTPLGSPLPHLQLHRLDELLSLLPADKH